MSKRKDLFGAEFSNNDRWSNLFSDKPVRETKAQRKARLKEEQKAAIKSSTSAQQQDRLANNHLASISAIKAPGTFLRFYDQGYLQQVVKRASSEFIPSLQDKFLVELAQAQRDFRPDSSIIKRVTKLGETAESNEKNARALQARIDNSDSQEEKSKLQIELAQKIKAANDARHEQWSRYNKSRVKATRDFATRFQHYNEELAAAVLKACDVEDREIDWLNKSRNFNDKIKGLNNFDKYQQALKNHTEYIEWFEDVLKNAIKLPEEQVQAEVNLVEKDFQDIVAIIRSEQSIALILEEIIYNATLANLYELKDAPNAEKQQYAKPIITSLVSGFFGQQFTKEYLKENPSQDIGEITKRYLGKLVNDPQEVDQLLTWVYSKLNSDKFTQGKEELQIKQGTDFHESLIKRSSARFLDIAYKNAREKILEAGFDISTDDDINQAQLFEKIQTYLKDDEKANNILKVIQGVLKSTANDFTITNSSLRNYIESHAIPKALYKIGLLKTTLGGNQSDVVLGTLIPNSQVIKTEFNNETIRPTSIQRMVATHGTAMPNIFENKDGSIFVSQENLFMITAPLFAEAQLWHEDFQEQFVNKTFDPTTNPLDLRNYFEAYLVEKTKDNQGKVSEEGFREGFLEAFLPEQIAISQTNSFIDSFAYEAMPHDYFWGARSVAKGDAIEQLLKDRSKVKEFFEKHKADFDQAVIDSAAAADNKDWNAILHGFTRLEAKLRSLAVSDDPAQVLAEALTGIVLPNRRTEATASSTNFDYLAQVMLTQLLTKELIGKGTYDTVDWNRLYVGDYKLENKDFATNWQEFSKDKKAYKEAGKDPYGLMQLRDSWYGFIKNKMPNFDEMNNYMRSGKIQNAAKAILAREFKSYSDRDSEFPGWQESYKQNLALSTYTNTKHTN